MKLQRLLSLARQAIDAYDMIEEGDRIAVGISGGKDSLTLLYALQMLSKFYPKHFEVYAVTVDLGFEKNMLKRCFKIWLAISAISKADAMTNLISIRGSEAPRILP